MRESTAAIVASVVEKTRRPGPSSSTTLSSWPWANFTPKTCIAWNVGLRSLKVIESGTIWKLGYGFLFAFYSSGIRRKRQNKLWVELSCWSRKTLVTIHWTHLSLTGICATSSCPAKTNNRTLLITLLLAATLTYLMFINDVTVTSSK